MDYTNSRFTLMLCGWSFLLGTAAHEIVDSGMIGLPVSKNPELCPAHDRLSGCRIGDVAAQLVPVGMCIATRFGTASHQHGGVALEQVSQWA